MDRPVALVVDRDPAVRAVVSGALEEGGFHTLGAESAAVAKEKLGGRSVSLVLVDLESIGPGAVDVIEHSQRLNPPPLVVGLGSTGAAVAGVDELRARLFDVTPKPVERERIARLSRRSLSQLALLEQVRRLRADLQSREGYHGIVGRTASMERFRTQIEGLAGSDEPVWITGERGTGRELAARILHGASGRAASPFVVLPCEEVRSPEELTGDGGVAERASGGTLFLEELPELRLDLQEDLLQSLSRHDASSSGPAEIARIVVAAREDAARASAGGRLVEGLRRRLSHHALSLPALRDRREDIVLLARHFINAICEVNHLPPIRITPDALMVLESYGWPGNVQELRNAMEQAVILSSEGIIEPYHLPDRVREATTPARGTPLEAGMSQRPFREVKREVVEAFERAYLGELLERYAGNVTSAAQQAGMLRSALQRLLRKYGLKSADFRRRRSRSVERGTASESSDDLH